MKTALVTTTINVPTVLDLYHRLSCDVMFVMGDKKTPDILAGTNVLYFDVEAQKSLGYACNDLIGWNTIRRRNIAVLEALKCGADIIVSIDDDNIPLDPTYFYEMETSINEPFNGCQVTSPNKWFDPGTLMVPRIKHRGFPHEMLAQDILVEPVVGVRVGVCAGLCLGDPDIDACTRMERKPIVHSVSELARAGVVTDPRRTWTVFNTQNTAYLRALAPAMFCAPGLGRHDDIYASLITQRIMRELGLCVHLGQPFVWQQRNPHNLLVDLNDEVFGMTHIMEFASLLNSLTFSDSKSVLSMVRGAYSWVSTVNWWPSIATEAALAWCDDCEAVL